MANYRMTGSSVRIFTRAVSFLHSCQSGNLMNVKNIKSLLGLESMLSCICLHFYHHLHYCQEYTESSTNGDPNSEADSRSNWRHKKTFMQGKMYVQLGNDTKAGEYIWQCIRQRNLSRDIILANYNHQCQADITWNGYYGLSWLL